MMEKNTYQGLRRLEKRSLLFCSALALAACSTNEPSELAKQSGTNSTATTGLSNEQSSETYIEIMAMCETLNYENWEPTPPNLNIPDIATALGTTETDVRQGESGILTCDPALTTADIASGKAIVTADERIIPCLVIGIDSVDPPDLARTYTNVLAVCPASPTAES